MRIWLIFVFLFAALAPLCGVAEEPDDGTSDVEELRRLIFVERKDRPKKAVPGTTQVPRNLFAQPNAIRPEPFNFQRRVPVPGAVPVPRRVPAPQVVPPRNVPNIIRGLDPRTLERVQPSAMDRLRRGMPPLPFPLTEESIETLTKEGIEIPDYLRP